MAAESAARALSYISLRYFNAAGADPEGEIGEWHDPEPHIVPSVIAAAFQKKAVSVFGNDYPTPDGTCVRDYINVTDLAQAHILAVEHLLNGKPSDTLNLGTGRGYSVGEIVDHVAQLLEIPTLIENAPRRLGDPAELVARADRARAGLGWEPQQSKLEEILASAISWHRRMQACR